MYHMVLNRSWWFYITVIKNIYIYIYMEGTHMYTTSKKFLQSFVSWKGYRGLLNINIIYAIP